ncbi:DNA polymerase IV [Deferribacter desulfuricans SSM1]|uniref:DNA polymerase IV n=1 Tax=Deferribacter desulfuricans (strain DSM 14783 / JCM 11476 / NBRC 101012 / SSM1) TaxID=639282 RepID=D3PBJ8_DEFDS|nr:DNA polymerase IV [Deferribacter desulfuricans]BAI79971.1 DNA polymerase IV [Deferribacter desulfuricans SSM1]
MIMCIDMDAFFASVEQASNPLLRGKPVAVIGAKERTVVTTASYEARKYGVKTGMSKFEAMRLCPRIVLVVGNNRKYTYVSKQIYNFLLTITSDVEMYSVDEAFLDLSSVNLPPEDVAFMIKSFIKSKFGITCSIGVGSNKLIAKMASGINKPDGFCYVPREKNKDFIDSFPISKIWGVGRRLAKRFENLGIFSTKDLRDFGVDSLVEMFGKNGYKLYAMANGEYFEGVNTNEEPVKSIGHSMTLPMDIFNMDELSPYLLQLCEMVSERARQNRVSGKRLFVVIRDTDMKSFGKSYTLPFFTSATHHIYDFAKKIIEDFDISKGVRLVGVSLGKLVHDAVCLQNIFEDERKSKLYRAMDKINKKYGSFSISYASILKCRRKGALTISPAWKPDGIRNVNVK